MIIETWILEHKIIRPHSCLPNLSPNVVAELWEYYKKHSIGKKHKPGGKVKCYNLLIK